MRSFPLRSRAPREHPFRMGASEIPVLLRFFGFESSAHSIRQGHFWLIPIARCGCGERRQQGAGKYVAPCASGASDFAKASSGLRRQPSFATAASVGELRLDLAEAVARKEPSHGGGGKPEGRRREPGAPPSAEPSARAEREPKASREARRAGVGSPCHCKKTPASVGQRANERTRSERALKECADESLNGRQIE